MFKRFSVVLAVLLILIGTSLASSKPTFSKFSDTYELYLYDSSSNAVIVNATKKSFFDFKRVKGESFKTKSEGFSVEEFFLSMDAQLLFTERTAEGVSYYGYGKNIKYRERIKGCEVNLHVFVGKEEVTVGAPIIYGSF